MAVRFYEKHRLRHRKQSPRRYENYYENYDPPAPRQHEYIYIITQAHGHDMRCVMPCEACGAPPRAIGDRPARPGTAAARTATESVGGGAVPLPADRRRRMHDACSMQLHASLTQVIHTRPRAQRALALSSALAAHTHTHTHASIFVGRARSSESCDLPRPYPSFVQDASVADLVLTV